MKVSLNWAQWYSDVDLKAKSTDELVKLATERLGGVEGYVELGKHYDGIVIAKVVSCEKHPNADKLNICKIDDNNYTPDVKRDENGYVQVVCGAPNVREGLLVAWVPPSAIVPASYGEKELFVLEARDLRGQLSNGMLASPRELGISEDHEGILEIDPTTPASSIGSENGNAIVKPGMLFKELYDLDDVIIDIENKMFTHRPDCFGQLGVARELAGIQHKAFKSPDWYLKTVVPFVDSEALAATAAQTRRAQTEASNENSKLSVTIEAEDLCPRYMAVVIDNVEIKPSPIWLQSYLKRVGIRPINNVVDITNYIMVLTAQPLHAFDFDKVAKDGQATITVRRPKSGEKMTLLDGKEIEPHKDAVLICNQDGPIALGGVMGGGNSEIDQNTTRIVLECATFDMYNIRKTSMIHGIFTDAVTRFNKGQPAAQLPPVVYKTMQLFEELTGAKMTSGVVDSVSPTAQDKQQATNYIELTSKFINERLGSKFTDQEIIDLLTNVEFEAHTASGPISVTPPFWRTDIEIPEDIVEEVGRLYGFNQLPVTLPQRSIKPVAPEPLSLLKSEIRTGLSRAGANEVLTYSFVHGDTLKKAGQDPGRAFALRNALSPDLQYYRLSLLPSLLDKVHANIKAGYDEFVLFEIGKTHSKYSDDKPSNLPDEYNFLEVVYTSSKPKEGAAYYQMLRYVGYLLSDLGIPYRLEKPEQEIIENPAKKIQAEKPFNMERSAYMFYEQAAQGGMIGVVGELEESVITSFKLPQYTAAAIFALDGASFETENRTNSTYNPLSRYQSSKQDITLKVSESLPFIQLKSILLDELAKTEYQTTLAPLGVYQKDGEDSKNITFRLTLSHPERTLTTAEVNKLVEKITWQANELVGAEQI